MSLAIATRVAFGAAAYVRVSSRASAPAFAGVASASDAGRLAEKVERRSQNLLAGAVAPAVPFKAATDTAPMTQHVSATLTEIERG